ncbi:diguanylate cyclase domain-containing protein [Jannaschia sp. R86511]|uniref:diguanylate cyclase domain-containing protein n=1 Tax=Jannaschia sp. R86511 TaxID=3093853 RepID=UPI0036D2B5C6
MFPATLGKTPRKPDGGAGDNGERARALAGGVRETDSVARLGGDEFAVLIAPASPACAAAIGERVRLAVAVAGRAHQVTGSVGVSVVRAGEDVQALLGRTDSAMYRAKQAGGDRSEIAHGDRVEEQAAGQCGGIDAGWAVRS